MESDLRLDDKSRMSREVHVRFCEGLGVRLPRATRLVVLARYQGRDLVSWIEQTLEGWMGLQVNRAKTRIVDLNQIGARVDFLGYSFRYDLDLQGRGHQYLNVFPSKKAQARERERLRQMTSPRMCFKPIPALIRELNRHLNGWSNYFSFGYPRMAMRHINWYSRQRLYKHLKRRSQRPYHPRQGVSVYRHLSDLGLVYL